MFKTNIFIHNILQSSFSGSHIFGAVEIVLDKASPSIWRLIIALDQESNKNILRMPFQSSINQMVGWIYSL